MGRRRKHKKGAPWQIGGKKAPLWLRAPCDPIVKAGTQADYAQLMDAFSFGSLDPAHPLATLWNLREDERALAEARFEFHHLADDLRQVRGVAGANGLVAIMKRDVEGYHDFRYELRIAGSVARSATQRLIRLAGSDSGPDIEVQSKSAHRCGIACYRARTVTPALSSVGDTTAQLAKLLGQVVARRPLPIGVRLSINIEFPIFPIPKENVRDAVGLFDKLWSKPSLPEAKMEDSGIKVSRVSIGDSTIPLTWEVWTKFRMPVPAREKYRLCNHIRDKLNKENQAWAGAYAGVPVFAAEESDFCLGFPTEELKALMRADSGHHFELLFSTLAYFGDASSRGRFRMEEIHPIHRESGLTLNLGIETFGDNSARFGDGHLVMSFNPHHAEEEWRFLPGAPPEKVAAYCIRPLTIERRISRAPIPEGTPLTGDALHPTILELVGRVGKPGRFLAL